PPPGAALSLPGLLRPADPRAAHGVVVPGVPPLLAAESPHISSPAAARSRLLRPVAFPSRARDRLPGGRADAGDRVPRLPTARAPAHPLPLKDGEIPHPHARVRHPPYPR